MALASLHGMNEQIKTFAVAFVTDLVSRGILAKEVNGTWTLPVPLMGYAGDVAFHSRDELIQKVAQAAIQQYGTGLKAAS